MATSASKNGTNGAANLATATINSSGLPEAAASKVIARPRLRAAILANDEAERFFAKSGTEVPSAFKLKKAVENLVEAQDAMKEFGIRAPKLPSATRQIVRKFLSAQSVFKKEQFSPSAVRTEAKASFILAVQTLEGGPQ